MSSNSVAIKQPLDVYMYLRCDDVINNKELVMNKIHLQV